MLVGINSRIRTIPIDHSGLPGEEDPVDFLLKLMMIFQKSGQKIMVCQRYWRRMASFAISNKLQLF
ncbi:hypothetical protein Ocin01_07471 [Orchesella cincta]|uniref:Uncharacterized protein n=1 Tax=Orchesella cincta TaxID=48709 RepID=A0A1D2N1W0_ORCCI|nr:hypothetical protein Ocin01_07471 [Orchesella cincta]